MRADAADLQYIEVQYEDLVRDTEPQLRRVADFLELPWDDSMLRYYERAEERLSEMHRDLPGEDGKPLRPADHRKEAHVLTSKPPDPSRLAHFVPDLIKAARADAGVDGMLAAMTGNRTWGDFGIDDDEMRRRLEEIPAGDPAEAVRTFFDAYAERQGKPRWGDKTPATCSRCSGSGGPCRSRASYT